MRFPNLTANDWQYCRDILFSGEVRVWEPETTVPGGYAELIGRRAVVSGDIGDWKPNDIKDFEIGLTFVSIPAPAWDATRDYTEHSAERQFQSTRPHGTRR